METFTDFCVSHWNQWMLAFPCKNKREWRKNYKRHKTLHEKPGYFGTWHHCFFSLIWRTQISLLLFSPMYSSMRKCWFHPLSISNSIYLERLFVPWPPHLNLMWHRILTHSLHTPTPWTPGPLAAASVTLLYHFWDPISCQTQM